MLSGESESPRAKNLQSLATVLRCDPSYLTGVLSEPGSLTGPVDGNPTIRIVGEARFGSWGASAEPLPGAGVLFLAPIPDISASKQMAVILADRHMDDLLPANTVLHLETSRSIQLSEGDVVVVSRLRFDGAMAELTARSVTISGFKTKLTTRYRNPDLNESIDFIPSEENPYEGVAGEGGDQILILGRAVRAYVGLARPTMYELDDERRRLEIVAMTKKLP
jgi:hypothetical protein